MHCSAFASDLGSAPLSRIPWTARAANAGCLFSCPLSRDNVASCFRCAESSRTFLAICIGSFFSFSCVSSPHAGERFADGQSCWRLHVAPCPKSLWRRPALIPHPFLPLRSVAFFASWRASNAGIAVASEIRTSRDGRVS